MRKILGIYEIKEVLEDSIWTLAHEHSKDEYLTIDGTLFLLTLRFEDEKLIGSVTLLIKDIINGSTHLYPIKDIWSLANDDIRIETSKGILDISHPDDLEKILIKLMKDKPNKGVNKNG